LWPTHQPLSSRSIDRGKKPGFGTALYFHHSAVNKRIDGVATRFDNLLPPRLDMRIDTPSQDKLDTFYHCTRVTAVHHLCTAGIDGATHHGGKTANHLDPTAVDGDEAGRAAGPDELGTPIDYIANGRAENEIEAATVDCGGLGDAARPHDLEAAVDHPQVGHAKYDLVAAAVDGRGYCGAGDQPRGYPFNDLSAAVYNGVRRCPIIVDQAEAASIDGGPASESAIHVLMPAAVDYGSVGKTPAANHKDREVLDRGAERAPIRVDKLVGDLSAHSDAAQRRVGSDPAKHFQRATCKYNIANVGLAGRNGMGLAAANGGHAFLP